jgi:HD superfamily phosphodiesterase
VAGKAADVGAAVPVQDREIVVMAAWLHDVGYAPALVSSGLHALDGARWLRAQGWDDRLASLVANHSCALYEARERGLADQLAAEFPAEQSPTADALWYADMTTGPDGQHLRIEIIAAVRRTETRLAEAGIQPM